MYAKIQRSGYRISAYAGYLPVYFWGFILMLYAGSSSAQSSQPITPKGFLTPPAENHVHAWWHFVNKSFSKAGITKDLEAMKAQGISETTLLNINQFNGKDLSISDVKFASPEYFDMFKYALTEAKRLGITIGAHNCDGWSESGGPWINPENAMKQYTWSKTIVSGGKQVHIKLIEPAKKLNFYHDVKVLAYRSAANNSFVTAAPQISVEGGTDPAPLTDGNPSSYIEVKKGQSIIFNFKKPFGAQVLQVHTHKLFAWSGTRQRIRLEVATSGDGINYQTVGLVEDSLVNRNVLLNFKPQQARFYRIRVNDILFNGSSPLELAELSLLNAGETPLYQNLISNHQAKTVTVIANHYGDFYSTDTVKSKTLFPAENDVIDISDKMLPDGSLKWQAPAGNWTVLRFGYTATGAVNAPATKEGEGLECDKMDTAALNLHFANFPQKLIAAAGNYKGNTFKYLFVDSWECYYQNWTKGFENEFEKRRGYSPVPYIPVLCGEIVNNAETSEAFLHDFRRTIGELIEINYYKHLANLCHRNGLELHAESIYGGIFTPGIDVLKTNSYFDVPVTEFWAPLNAEDTLLRYNPANQINSTLPIHGATMYNKPIIASEAYTGFANFSDSPWNLKLWGDKGYTEGINQMVLHSYVHQPDDRKPGLTLGIYGASFNRNNTWWGEAKSWLDYQARIQYILQKSRVVADVLYYMGDKLPAQQAINKPAEIAEGIRADFCNSDILLYSAKVKDGRIVLNNGSSYPLLMFTDSLLELPVLEKIKELIHEGATVICPKPVATLSLYQKKQNDQLLKTIADDVWGQLNGMQIQQKTYGKGRVIWGVPLTDVYQKNSFPFDISVNGAKLNDLMWLHKRTTDEEIYYLVNKKESGVKDVKCRFRQSGLVPEIWDPVTGAVIHPGIYADQNGTITLPLHFNPKQSLFVIFRKGTQNHFDRVDDVNGKQIFPALTAMPVELPEVSINGKDSAVFTHDSAAPGKFSFSANGAGKIINVSFNNTLEHELTLVDGFVDFVNEPSIGKQKIDRFKPFQQFEDQRIKHYSGTAQYNVKFNLPSYFVGGHKKVLLTIQSFGSTANIAVNNGAESKIWIPGQAIDITGNVKTGQNTMIITVTNPWRNHLLGAPDAGLPVWTTAPALPAKLSLLKSGISGIFIKSVEDHFIKF